MFGYKCEYVLSVVFYLRVLTAHLSKAEKHLTAGNIHDSIAWDKVYDEVTHKYAVEFVTMDAGYKTPWMQRKY